MGSAIIQTQDSCIYFHIATVVELNGDGGDISINTTLFMESSLVVEQSITTVIHYPKVVGKNAIGIIALGDEGSCGLILNLTGTRGIGSIKINIDTGPSYGIFILQYSSRIQIDETSDAGGSL